MKEEVFQKAMNRGCNEQPCFRAELRSFAEVLLGFVRGAWPELLILGVAVLLRFWKLDIKPAHFDEGINGWFADQMRGLGYYRYDPSNYHGPLHFYAVFLSQALFGRSLWALRLPTVLASILCVVAMFGFRRHFGRFVAGFGALCMAVSPGYVFYGRYAIHESWQVLFLLLLVQGVLGLWESGKRQDVWLVSAGFAGMLLTKETWVLHVGCMGLAVPVLMILNRWVPSRPAVLRGAPSWGVRDALLAGVTALAAVVFFYSGGFLDFGLLKGLWETFAHWFETGVAHTGHTKPEYDVWWVLNYYWFALMARYEWPALAGVVAAIRAIWPADARWRWLAIASVGSLAAYSIVPYKTPWCILTFAWPFYLILGNVVEECMRRVRREVLLLPALLLLVGSLFICWRLNFVNFTDETAEPYVYVQTHVDIRWVTDPLLALARLDPEGAHVKGAILLDSYYPLPWMLGDFTRVGYFEDLQVPSPLDHDFIILPTAREPEVEPLLEKAYFKIPFRLRGGMASCTAYLSVERYERVVGEGSVVGGP